MDDVRRAQWALLAELAAGTAVSTGVGVVAWKAGRRKDCRFWRSFGRQTLAWAAVDAGVLALAIAKRGPAPADDAGARSLGRKMALITGANAVADVAYLAGGVEVARRWPARRGDGVAVVLQGLFLLWLDARYAKRFAVQARRRA